MGTLRVPVLTVKARYTERLNATQDGLLRLKLEQALELARRHHQAGRLAQANTLYREILGTSPANPDALHLLGVLTIQLGEPDVGAGLIRQAIQHNAGDADYHANLGMALSAMAELEGAISAYEQALRINPHHANALYSLGSAQRALGRAKEAITSITRSLEIEPGAVEVRANLAALLLENHDPVAALDQCEACLRAQPGDRLAIGYKAIALQHMEEFERARQWLALERLINTETLAVPDSYDSLKAFNAVLAQHIRQHPTLEQEHTSKATRNGLQTGDLLTSPKGPFGVFEKTIKDAIKRYLIEHRGHPHFSNGPQTWRIDMWGVVLNTAGHQSAHMHPGGWVSGVYYVELPSQIDAIASAGWIEFGRPPVELGRVSESELRVIRPEVGKLVLFPSYVFHQTVPFISNQQRISVAFDVLSTD